MRRSTALMSVTAMAIFASSAFAQAKPNFAGSWNMVVDSAAQAAQQQAAAAGGGGRGGGRGGRGGFGMVFSAAQEGNVLTITRSQGQMEMKEVYNLDGTPSTNTGMGRGDQPGPTSTSTSKWEGNSLVITTKTDFNGQTRESTRKLTIDDKGDLWVETTNQGQNGPMTTKVQYKKGVTISK